ncbi:MAG: T9SS type A sorting domain-containing protein [Flavobacteriales bacterium]|nr:T9SS type A sorting domain-containing protein [Flavobacteriales bacterium]
MKRILFAVVATLMLSQVEAQVVFSTSFENWTGADPDGWKGSKTNFAADSIIMVTTGTIYGTKAVQLNNTTTSHKRFTTQPMAVTQGQVFEVSFWVKGRGDVRIGIFDSSNVATTSGYHYAAYNTINTTNWTQYTQSITADTTWNTAQFIVSVKNTIPSSNHIQIDSLVISLPSAPSTVSIYDIQYSTVAPYDSPLNNTSVNTGGIVSAVYASGYFIQDNSGAWNGVHVFDNTHTPAIGDSILISGNVTEYFNMTQISSISSYTTVSTGNPVHAAVVIPTASVNLEDYEGVLVQVTNANCVNANAGFGMWTVNDGSADCKIHNLIYQYTPTQGNVYAVTGPVYYSFAEFRVEPRDVNDVIVQGFAGVEEGSLSNLNIYPNPASDFFVVQDVEMNSSVEIYDLSGRMIKSTIISKENQQISVSELKSGSYIVLVSSNKGSYSTKLVK